MKNKKWQWDSPIYVHLKKHFCPVCCNQLTVKRIRQIVNSESKEAQEFDFSFPGDGGFMRGNVEFSFEVFNCDTCNKKYTVKEMKKIEKKTKNAK